MGICRHALAFRRQAANFVRSILPEQARFRDLNASYRRITLQQLHRRLLI